MANGDKNEQAATETQIKTEQPKTPLPPSNLEIKGEETSVVPTLNPETAATATFTTPPDWKMISYKELKLDLPDPDPNIKVVEDTITLSGKPNSGLEQFAVDLHAYCLRPNHLHLALQTPEGNLSRFMAWLQTTFTARYNRKHRRSGHLFQGRYRDELVKNASYGNG